MGQPGLAAILLQLKRRRAATLLQLTRRRAAFLLQLSPALLPEFRRIPKNSKAKDFRGLQWRP